MPYGAQPLASGGVSLQSTGISGPPRQAIANRLAFARLQHIARSFGLQLSWLDCLPWDQVERTFTNVGGRDQLRRWIEEPPYSDERFGPTKADVADTLRVVLALWGALHAARAALGLTGPAPAVAETHSVTDRNFVSADHPPPSAATATRQLVAAPSDPPTI